MAMTITWFGHSTFRLEVGNFSVLIDPFLTGNPLCEIAPDEIPAQFILLTHGHGDHFGDTVAIAKRTEALVVATPEICDWVGGKGVKNTHGMNTGGGYTFPFGHVKFVRADHSSSLPDGTYAGNPCGLVISHEGKRLYFAGDTALFSDMSLIGDMRIDVAVLPIGDNFTMGPDDALAAVKLIRPRNVFPCHYNTFPVIYQDVAKWALRVNNETNAQAIVVDPGLSFSV